MKKFSCLLLLFIATLCLFSCSNNDDGDLSIHHAWYWQDEMPKNYINLLVFEPNGRVIRGITRTMPQRSMTKCITMPQKQKKK